MLGRAKERRNSQIQLTLQVKQPKGMTAICKNDEKRECEPEMARDREFGCLPLEAKKMSDSCSGLFGKSQRIGRGRGAGVAPN